MSKKVLVLLFISWVSAAMSQSIPAEYENIPFLVTFSKDADAKWGDDDFNQIFFFTIPENNSSPFYIRVYDPDIGGLNDENKSGFNSTTKFTVYGGDCFSKIDNENQNPSGNYKKGNVLASRKFTNDPKYDAKWFTFGPFNPMEGKLLPELGGYVFKLIVDGMNGDDGNLYKCYLSSKRDLNKEVEGGNAFTYEYCFRLPSKIGAVSHIYPFIDNETISVKQFNFDFDNDAYLKVVSVAKNGYRFKPSGDNEWITQDAPITKAEKNTSLDIQIHNLGKQGNNNVVFRVTNQYGKNLRFYTVPIGGIPKYQYKIKVKR